MVYHPESLIVELEERARELRLDSLDMIYHRKAGHPGGSLSAAEIVTVLFFHKLRLDPQRPNWPERDRFILSKGHASAILYAALARLSSTSNGRGSITNSKSPSLTIFPSSK